jgi:hypothetical protein
VIHNRDRELNEAWITDAEAWIRERGETLLSIRYLYNSPPMNFALLRSIDHLRQVVHARPDGAELTLWRDVHLTVRGRDYVLISPTGAPAA